MNKIIGVIWAFAFVASLAVSVSSDGRPVKLQQLQNPETAPSNVPQSRVENKMGIGPLDVNQAGSSGGNAGICAATPSSSGGSLGANMSGSPDLAQTGVTDRSPAGTGPSGTAGSASSGPSR